MYKEEISLKELMKKILKQWRVLLISMILCAILVTVVGGIMSIQQVDAAEKALAEQITNGGPKEGEQLIVVPRVVLISVKYIVFGLLLGIVVDAGYVTVGYVMTSKLRCVLDMTQVFDVSVMGVIKLDNVIKHDRKKSRFGFIDQAIENCFRDGKEIPKDTNIKIISTDIALAMKKNDVQTICFTGNADSEIVQSIIQTLRTADKEKSLTISFNELAIYSPEALETMLTSESVVLFETVGKSQFADISKQLEYCKRYDIPVLGCVVIE